jgi:hypothetical protein
VDGQARVLEGWSKPIAAGFLGGNALPTLLQRVLPGSTLHSSRFACAAKGEGHWQHGPKCQGVDTALPVRHVWSSGNLGAQDSSVLLRRLSLQKSPGVNQSHYLPALR